MQGSIGGEALEGDATDPTVARTRRASGLDIVNEEVISGFLYGISGDSASFIGASPFDGRGEPILV
jgi:hypothetical protein